MAIGGLPVERLRGYLRELPSTTRALLIAELERGLLRGDDIPGGDLLLQEVRSAVRESREFEPRVNSAARQFFRPLKPFLVDDDPVHRHPARIARASLKPLWEWIARDVLPEETERFTADIGRAQIAEDPAIRDGLLRSFRQQVIQRFHSMLAEAQDDSKALRRLSSQIGTPDALDDVRNVLAILSGRELLAGIENRLPGHIRNLADAQLAELKSMLDSAFGNRTDLLPYALILVMGRLASPWQLIRFAVAAAESDKEARIAGTTYAIAVAITFADIERMVAELKSDLKSGRGVAVTALLKCIHDAVRGVRSELDLAPDSAWGRELAAVRTEVSNALRMEIEPTPARVRRLLRPPHKATSAAALDPIEIGETEALIELLKACRHYASELAISEVTQRAHAELQQYLDSGTQALLDVLRSCEPADRPFRQSQLNAAVRFCGKVFGPEYAALLGKAAEVAAGGERKTARG